MSCFYIQITNRCNMRCPHCCFACTSRGSDMSKDDFYAAIRLAKENDEPVTIGGGEPTLHPLFKDFILHAQWELAYLGWSFGSPAVAVITNGSNTEISLTLARLAETGTISATVSHDEYHDPVDERVYAAFQRKPANPHNPRPEDEHDHRGVNGYGGLIIPVGRAKQWGTHPTARCACPDIFITPKGKVYPCACRKTCLGHVSGEVILTDYQHEGMCENSDHYKDAVKKAAEKMKKILSESC